MASPRIFAFALLYALLFGGLGAELPYLPYYFTTSGLSAAQIGAILTAGTITQVLAGPLFGLAADRFGTRLVLGLAAAAAAASFPLFLAAPGGLPHAFFIYVIFAIVTAPLNPLADALSVPACRRAGVPYGRIRGMGSFGFFSGVLASSIVTSRLGISAIIPMSSILFGLMAVSVSLSSAAPRPATCDKVTDGIGLLARNRQFRRVLLVAAMVIGSHAMSDAFAVIHWAASGFGTQVIGILLVLGVASEFIVFVAVGPALLARFGPATCASVGALAGVVRWAVLAEAQSIWLLLATQLLHGLTFSLVHLACMQVLASFTPRRFFATAQSIYGICCNAIASAVITAVAGIMFTTLHARAFWLASALCGLALPIAFQLKGRADKLPE